jgi:hypothetical protein
MVLSGDQCQLTIDIKDEGKEVIGDECYYLASKFQVIYELPHTPRALGVYKIDLFLF